MKQDQDLAALRQRADFQKLLAELAAKNEPLISLTLALWKTRKLLVRPSFLC